MPIDLRVGVDERATRVAGRDRGVGLDEVDERLRLLGRAGDGALQAGDDAGGDGVLEAERAADGHGELADLGQVLLELSGRQTGLVDLEHRDVGRRVSAHEASRRPARRRRSETVYVRATRDDVVVGDDVAVGAVDDAAAQAVLSRNGYDRWLGLLDDVNDRAEWIDWTGRARAPALLWVTLRQRRTGALLEPGRPAFWRCRLTRWDRCRCRGAREL